MVQLPPTRMKEHLPIQFDMIPIPHASAVEPSRENILRDVELLRAMHRRGDLGGQLMPEDVHPVVARDSAALYHYFSLSMALNFQRDSYALWRAATATFNDPETSCIFDPLSVVQMPIELLTSHLGRHRVALQHNKHPAIWAKICGGICDHLDGDIRTLFSRANRSVPTILEFIQITHKAQFPYLSGPKIANYWLYVIDQYTDAGLTQKEALSVAPDTHVIQASIKLGVVPPDIRDRPEAQRIVSDAWRRVLAGTDLVPIDVHTPLWLWSRGGFVSLTID